MIALHAQDRFGLLLGCGIVSLLALQAAVNIGVTTSLLPNKGIAAALHQLRRIESGRLPFRHRHAAEHLSPGRARTGDAKKRACRCSVRDDPANLMNVVIACGGTGGHLFPGLAVAEVLRERGHEVMLFISEKEIDALALSEPFRVSL